MINWLAYILITLVYSLALILQKKRVKENSHIPTPIPSIIATPSKYIINIIENEDEIDYREYADVSINIKDILEKNNTNNNEKPNENATPQIISFENIDFSEFVNIKIKNNEN